MFFAVSPVCTSFSHLSRAGASFRPVLLFDIATSRDAMLWRHLAGNYSNLHVIKCTSTSEPVAFRVLCQSDWPGARQPLVIRKLPDVKSTGSSAESYALLMTSQLSNCAPSRRVGPSYHDRTQS